MSPPDFVGGDNWYSNKHSKAEQLKWRSHASTISWGTLLPNLQRLAWSASRWIINYIPVKECDAIAHLCSKFNGCLTHLPLCHIYASLDWVSIGSVNGLSPVRHIAITWTNADLLSIGSLGTTFSENWIEIPIFIQENAIENVVTQKGGYFVQGEMS